MFFNGSITRWPNDSITTWRDQPMIHIEGSFYEKAVVGPPADGGHDSSLPTERRALP